LEPRPDGLVIREARPEDLPAIIALFADDDVGGHGDTTDIAALPEYRAAYDRILASPADRLWVADLDGLVAGTFQTTLTPKISGRGRLVLTVEGVQTRAGLRGRGIGAAMMNHAVTVARGAGAEIVQLSSNASRTEAHRFYERLGFARSHVAFKMKV